MALEAESLIIEKYLLLATGREQWSHRSGGPRNPQIPVTLGQTPCSFWFCSFEYFQVRWGACCVGHVEVREQLVGVVSVLVPCGF